jgi:xanthine permease XanP
MSAAAARLARRPLGLVYGVDDVPPWLSQAMLGFQHFVVIAPQLALVVLVTRASGVGAEMIAATLSWTLIVLAISSSLQSWTRTGSGFFIPGCNSAVYAGGSLAAAATGGLALLGGMTLFAGLFQIFFAHVLVRVRRFFPIEIVALSVIIVGFELGAIGLRRIEADAVRGLPIGALTFFLSVALGVYGRGAWRLYCALIGIFAGYAAAVYTGMVGDPLLGAFSGPLFALPSIVHVGFSFDLAYVPVFVVAAIAASLKTMGAVVTSDRINDASWARPNIGLIRKGIVVDGLSTALAGLAGSCGTNSSTNSVGVAQASGATSRRIGYAVSAWMLLFALSPAFTSLVTSMPDAVVGGGLIFSACMVTVNGLQLLSSVTMDMRRAGVVAFPLLLAIASVGNSPFLALMPSWLQPFLSSALGVGVLAALAVNAFFSMGMARRSEVVLGRGVAVSEQLAPVRAVLAGWSVAHNVQTRVMLTLREVLDARCSRVGLKFDGATLRLDITRESGPQDESGEARPHGFFTAQVSDKLVWRKRRSGRQVLSAFYEQ